MKENLQAAPGLLESLKFFKKRKYRIAIASSGTKVYINLVLGKFRIKDYFDAIVSGDDVRKGKPDPETYMVASKKLGLKSQECLVLEDATNGIESAKRAGCVCIAIRNPHTPPQDLSRADLILGSLKDISEKVILFLNTGIIKT